MNPRRSTDAPSLNSRIRADLEAKIASGDWPPGYRIPFEHELMVTYGCSRMTVNRVLAAMADAGLIERRRRAGSFVRRPAFQSAVLRIPDIGADVAARGDTYGYRLLDRTIRIATPADQRLASIPVGESVLELQSLHLANGEPLAHEQRLINLATVPDAIDVDFEAVAPGKWLLDHTPWVDADHHIRAANPTEGNAALLEMPITGACLVVERRTSRPDGTVTWVRQTFRGDRYHLVAHFAAERQNDHFDHRAGSA